VERVVARVHAPLERGYEWLLVRVMRRRWIVVTL
jgi:hypothetical protein